MNDATHMGGETGAGSAIAPQGFIRFRMHGSRVQGTVGMEVVTRETLHRERETYVALLIEAVDSGAGMGFLCPLDRAGAVGFWADVARDIDGGKRVVIAARIGGTVVGTAQIVFSDTPNGRHRAEVQKVMVSHAARRRGIGRALMAAVDDAARDHGRSTLFLDTFADQGARRLYEESGWCHAGDIPAFARTSTGALGAASLYYRILPPRGEEGHVAVKTTDPDK